MRFRKKPLIVDAVKFDGTYRCYLNEVEQFVGRDRLSPFLMDRFFIKAPNRHTFVNPSDWIVKDSAGEFSVCTDDLFRKTYDEIAEPTVEAK